MVERVEHMGQQLGSYRLSRLLGQGGFADVYLGEHVYLGTFAAIKVLQVHLGNEEKQNFLDEARIVAHLVHPHIVRVFDFGVEGNTAFLVMEYASNGTLRQRYPKGTRLPLEIIVSYVNQVASALQYAHDRKLIHRDVKPENMLLGSNNEVLLSDFGLVLAVQSARLDNTQEAIGTLAYMAPEQLQGKPRQASDQYALGVIVYEWLSGEQPFQGYFSEVANQHMIAAPPPLHEKVPAISPEIEHIIQIALSKNPAHRFPSVQMFASAFELASQRFLAQQGGQQSATLPGQLSQPAEPPALEQAVQPVFVAPSSNNSPAPGLFNPLPRPANATPAVELLANALGLPSQATQTVPAPDASLLPTSVTPVPVQTPLMIPYQEPPGGYGTPAPDQPGQPDFVPGMLNQPPLSASPTWANQPMAAADKAELPLRQDKGNTSRRSFIFGLAGLGVLSLVGGGIAVALLAQKPQTPVLVPTATPHPTESPAAQATATPAPTNTPTATPTHTPSPTATATPSPTPTNTPTPTPTPSPTPTPVPIVSQGSGTIPGNGLFNFDQGAVVTGGADVLWHIHVPTTVRTLDPRRSAKLANMGMINFNSITAAQLKSLTYTTTPIKGENLPTGDVFAVLTNGGNHAKVHVTGYGYNLKIRWVTYRG